MKQPFVTEEIVFQVLRQRIAEVLRIDENSIGLDSSLIKDLGAESLDFLDINYGLEQSFGIKMPRHFVLEHVEEMFGEESAIDGNGQLTPQGAALLRLRFGDEYGPLKPGMDMDEITPLVTVRLVAKGVLEILDTLPERCARCGQAAWTRADGTGILCGKCGERASFTNGDDVIKTWLRRAQEEHRIFS